MGTLTGQIKLKKKFSGRIKMIQQVSPYGDLLQFETAAGFTCMSVNGVMSAEIVSSGNIDRDIGLLIMQGYDE